MDLVSRVKGLLLEPQAEWRRIADEAHTTSGLLKNYVAVLAAIPAICGLIGSTLIGASLLSSLLFAVLSYLLTFVAVLAEAMLIEALAPVFKSGKNFANAVKLAAFFPTAYWLAAVFFAVPVLSVLVLLGAYSFYLLWVGLPILMRVPEEQAAAYAASAAVGAIIFAAIASTIAARLSGVSLWV
jgi:hypothetical protein